MSLVNQMLRDLEKRRAEERRGSGRVFQGLASIDEPRRSRGPLPMVAAVVVLVLSGVVAYLLLERHAAAAKGESNVTSLHTAVVASPAPAVIELPPPNGASPITVAPTATVREERVALEPVAESTLSQEKARVVASTQGIAAAPLASNTAAQPAPRRRAETKSVAAVPPVTEPAVAVTIEKTALPPTSQQLAAAAYQKGYEALRAGKSDEAETHLREALRIDSTHLAARESLAGLLLSSGRRVEAAEVIDAGVKQQPAVASLRKLQARLLMEQGDAAGAIATLEAGSEMAASDGEYHALLAALYQRAGAFDKSVAAYQRAIGVNPNQGVWWLGLAISTERVGLPKEAAAAYQRALQAGIGEKLSAYARERIAALNAAP